MIEMYQQEPDKIKEIALYAAAIAYSGVDLPNRKPFKVIGAAKEFEAYLRG